MTLDEVKKRVTGAKYRILKEERLGNDTGSQLRLDGGAIINVFDNGTVSCQGKNAKIVEEQLGLGVAASRPAPTPDGQPAKPRGTSNRVGWSWLHGCRGLANSG